MSPRPVSAPRRPRESAGWPRCCRTAVALRAWDVRSQQQEEDRGGSQPHDGERHQARQAVQPGELAEVPGCVRIASAAQVLDVDAVVHEGLWVEREIAVAER